MTAPAAARLRAGQLPREFPEPWAVEWGEDDHTLFMSFAVGDVQQRMRWIRPGTFLMGSPEGEPGRGTDEGPQHLITLREGYWLADTPCTQALWEAVMGRNPSRFNSLDRPVERVSWDDCQEFLAKIGELVPGLRLPTEAEWEYACRAGTTGMTWRGDFAIKGENNAPGLDDIAWYGGNSGEGFELAEGEDCRSWPNKQYPRTTKAGTRPVARKDPNPYGLYDMLGNVYEWCSDWYGPYEAGHLYDPSGPPTGSLRVLRGGSWGSNARDVRAARRTWHWDPADRGGYLGLRLARGQSAQSSQQEKTSGPQSGPARRKGGEDR